MSCTKDTTHGACALSFYASFICSIDRPYNPISHYIAYIAYIAYMRIKSHYIARSL